MRKRAATFADKEKQVLITVAEKIGSTFGRVAALGKVAKKASRATPKPVRRRNPRPARTKSLSKSTRHVRRAARSKNTRAARRRK